MNPTIVEQFQAFWNQIATILPRVAAAMLLLLVGWVAAALVRRVTIKLLKLAKVDVISERAGFEAFLIQGGVRFTAVTLVAGFIYWLLILSAVSLSLSVAGVSVADELLRETLRYVPKVIVAILVVSFGGLFARVVRGAVTTYLNNIGVQGATPISFIAQYAILAFVATVALEQLGIGGATLTTAFTMAFGGFCLAFGLAFGLGGRRWAQAILEKLWKP